MLEGAGSSSNRRTVTGASHLNEVDVIDVGHRLDVLTTGRLACVDFRFKANTEKEEYKGVTLSSALGGSDEVGLSVRAKHAQRSGFGVRPIHEPKGSGKGCLVVGALQHHIPPHGIKSIVEVSGGSNTILETSLQGERCSSSTSCHEGKLIVTQQIDSSRHHLIESVHGSHLIECLLHGNGTLGAIGLGDTDKRIFEEEVARLVAQLAISDELDQRGEATQAVGVIQ